MRPHARRRSLLARVPLLVLMALALGGVLVENGQLLHVHGGNDGAALYNEQHVLATLLATPSGGAPLPEAPATVLLAVLAGLIVLFEGVKRSVAAARHAAPRAPPVR
jgi:putative copper export protein